MNRLKAHLGVFALAKHRGLVSPDYTVLRPRPYCSPRYFVDVLRTPLCRAELRKRTKGIVEGFWRLYTEDFYQILLPAPPPNEQKHIVDFLETHARIVARLINSKRRLIELLNEQKQAIIHHAVTRGLNPNVPLKPSGIEYLPTIPEKWKVLKLKHLGRIRYGLGQPPRESANGVPFIRATNVKSGKIIDKSMLYVDPDGVPPDRDAFLRKDEIIVVRSGALTADSAIIPARYEGSVAGYDMVVQVSRAIPQFIAATLLSRYVLVDQLHRLKSRAAQPHLNAEELGSSLLAVPSEPEQKKIVEDINRRTFDIERSILLTQHQIKLLREYCTRLIADVVTGKLDVRGINLDAAVDETDLLEDFEENEPEIDSDKEIDSMEGLDE